jgi:hypothetical protein
MTSAHPPGCRWHLDQYPWECDCVNKATRELLEKLIKWVETVETEDEPEYLNTGTGWADLSALADDAWFILNQ